MALSICAPISTDLSGRELVEHGTALFPVSCCHDDLNRSAVAWHWHEELEVFAVEHGCARICVSDTEYIIKQGEGVFINSGVLHGAWQVGEEPCRLRSLVFHPRFVGGSVDSIIWQKYLEPLLCDTSRPCIHFSGGQEWERAAINAICAAWQSCVFENAGFEFETRELLSQIILLLFKNRPLAEKKPPEKALRDGERVKVMLQYIQAHYGEEITLVQIAQSAHICESECLRCFRSVIGCTPIQYVRQIRLQRAAELLLCTERKIADIGQECGFQDMSYFSKAFRELNGCTPGEFRRRR